MKLFHRAVELVSSFEALQQVEQVKIETDADHLARVQALFEQRRDEMRARQIKHLCDQPVRRLDGRDAEYRKEAA